MRGRWDWNAPSWSIDKRKIHFRRYSRIVDPLKYAIIRGEIWQAGCSTRCNKTSFQLGRRLFRFDRLPAHNLILRAWTHGAGGAWFELELAIGACRCSLARSKDRDCLQASCPIEFTVSVRVGFVFHRNVLSAIVRANRYDR